MGYFKQYLRPLLHEVTQVFNCVESSRILSSLEEEFSLESMSNHFMHLIRLNEFILREYKTTKHCVRDKGIQYYKNQPDGETNFFENADEHKKKKYSSSLLTKKQKLIKRRRSSLCSSPLEMVSNSLSYLPASDLMSADKYGNTLIMKAAIKAIQNRKTNKFQVAFCDITKFNPTMIGTCKEFAEGIKDISFIGLSSGVQKVENIIVNKLNHCTNLRKLEFEYARVDLFDDSNFYLSNLLNAQDFISCVNRLTKNCKKRYHLQFSSKTSRIYCNRYLYENHFLFIKSVFQSLDSIRKITLIGENMQYEYHA